MSLKSLLFLFIMIASLSASEQLVVVVAKESNATFGKMQRYEQHNGHYVAIGSGVEVILGRNGLGWAQGSENLKVEGDGKSPMGLFSLTSTFGYDPFPNARMPYHQADDRLICVDDVNDSRYNTLISLEGPLPKSFEKMHREDEVYRNGIVIDYNTPAVSGRGSCIFIHLNHPDHRPTAGCTAMDEAPLKELLGWLNKAKNPTLLQISQTECAKYQKEFAGIQCE